MQLRTPSARRSSDRTLTALEHRICELEQLAHSHARELRIQFERIAQLQAEYDIQRRRSRMNSWTNDASRLGRDCSG